MGRFDLRAVWSAILLVLLAGCMGADQPAPETENAAGRTYRLYLLAGQSNMEGYGDAAELSAAQATPVHGAVIYAPASVPDDEAGQLTADWMPLRPGFGSAYPPDGVTSQFGPELTLGRTLAEEGPVALVKYARGGTALMPGTSGYGSWDPAYADAEGVNQFDHALAALRAATTELDVDGDGAPDRLVPSGIVWMQGEADAFDDAAAAAAYEANLTRLIAGLRGAMGEADLPVVIGRIVDSRSPGGAPVMAFARDVQAAQARVAAADSCAALVTALPAQGELFDGWHYGAAEQLALGAAFAEALNDLSGRCPATDSD